MKRLCIVGWSLLLVCVLVLVPCTARSEEYASVDEGISVEEGVSAEEGVSVEEDISVDEGIYDAQADYTKGRWGTCSWSIDAKGVLTIGPGVGEDTYGNSPWADLNIAITEIRTTTSGSSKVVAPESCNGLFAHLQNVTSMQLSSMDTSAVVDMSDMFRNCIDLESLDVSKWDVSLVSDMSSMFQDCRNLDSLQLFSLESSNVQCLSNMFRQCSALTKLDLSDWDTSMVSDMKSMFYRCSKLSTLDLEGWTTQNLEYTSNMFTGCSSLSALDLSSWDTLQVKGNGGAKGMFSYVSSLVNVRLGKRYIIKSADMFPDAQSSQSTWWSTLAGQWYSKNEIVSKRSGIADRYLVSMPNNFSDVGQKTAHNEDICWLSGAGISSGWNKGGGVYEFRPYANVARADMAAFLFRLAKLWGVVDEGWTPSQRLKSSFVDVTSSTSHHDDIWWLAEQGISAGWNTPNGKLFKPYDNVSRADMAAFVARLARYAGIDSISGGGGAPSFQDVGTTTAHSEDIRWLADAGISKGWAVGGSYEFRPYNNVARADMAAFLHRLNGMAV